MGVSLICIPHPKWLTLLYKGYVVSEGSLPELHLPPFVFWENNLPKTVSELYRTSLAPLMLLVRGKRCQFTSISATDCVRECEIWLLFSHAALEQVI